MLTRACTYWLNKYLFFFAYVRFLQFRRSSLINSSGSYAGVFSFVHCFLVSIFYLLLLLFDTYIFSLFLSFVYVFCCYFDWFLSNLRATNAKTNELFTFSSCSSELFFFLLLFLRLLRLLLSVSLCFPRHWQNCLLTSNTLQLNGIPLDSACYSVRQLSGVSSDRTAEWWRRMCLPRLPRCRKTLLVCRALSKKKREKQNEKKINK